MPSALNPDSRALIVRTEKNKEYIATAFQGREAIDGGYRYELKLHAEKLEPAELLGQGVTVLFRDELGQKSPRERFFHGICLGMARVEHQREQLDLDIYEVTLAPWFALLEQRINCAIFQDKTTSDIIKGIVSEHGFASQLDIKAKGGVKRDYCVQFNESDHDFILRLLSEEGWHFHFKQQDNKHTMIIGDNNRAFADCGEQSVEYFMESHHLPGAITQWEHHYQIVPGAIVTRDYNYELDKPIDSEKVSSKLGIKGQKKLHHYYYPGGYRERQHGNKIARAGIEALECNYSEVIGHSGRSGFYAGGCFKLEHHIEASEEGQYLLTRVEHDIAAQEPGQPLTYHNRFICKPAKTVYRPQRNYQKPCMLGLQSGTVCGPSGKEIYLDQYNRIKVRFHWDHQGADDGSATGWIRVSQPIASQGFGQQIIPRVGDEVLISFIDNDPNRPIVVGSAYNAKHKPPYEAPTQAGLRLRSTPKGGADNFSELRFECKKDQEEVFLQAEKDWGVLVKNNKKEEIKADYTQLVEKNVTRTTKQDDALNIEGQQTVKVKKAIQVETEADHLLKVKGDTKQQLESNYTSEIKGKTALTSQGDISQSTKADFSQSASGDIKLDASAINGVGKQAIEWKVGGSKIKLSSSGIEISCGANSVKVSQSGVEIKGMQVKAEANTQVQIKGSVGVAIEGTAQTEIKGTLVKVQGNAMTEIKAGAMVQVQGAITKIN